MPARLFRRSQREKLIQVLFLGGISAGLYWVSLRGFFCLIAANRLTFPDCLLVLLQAAEGVSLLRLDIARLRCPDFASPLAQAIVLSYPEQHKRGRYLAVWLFFKNSGTILAGAINLGTNIHRSTGGKGAWSSLCSCEFSADRDCKRAVNYKTLLAFIALQVLALPFAFLISKPERVQRDDRTPVPLPPKTTVKEQLKELWKACSTQKVGVLLPIFFVSLFEWRRSEAPTDTAPVHRHLGTTGATARVSSRCTSRSAPARSRPSSRQSAASSPPPSSASSSTRSASRSPRALALERP